MLRFLDVTAAPLNHLTLHAPPGAVIGIVGLEQDGPAMLLRLAAGVDQPVSGTVECTGPRALMHPADLPRIPDVKLLLIHQALALCDGLERARCVDRIHALRRNGATVLLYSHDAALLAEVADEVWWFHAGQLAAQGDPETTLARYGAAVAEAIRREGEGVRAALSRANRRGDGRARIVALDVIGDAGQPTGVLRSGEPADVRVGVHFDEAVFDPVVGIMLRTRAGVNVYGTNTQLEKLALGPRRAGDRITVSFRFNAALCPGAYTITAASHDPDGTWHEWLDDAVSLTITDGRYTAGIANLRAQVSLT